MADVTLLTSDRARDAGLVAALTDIVNRAYARGEAGLWRDGVPRTTAGAAQALVAAGVLAVARDGGRVVGCVRVARLDDTTAEQRLDTWYRRLGYREVGREDFAERFPEPARELVAPCDLVIYERPLATAAASVG